MYIPKFRLRKLDDNHQRNAWNTEEDQNAVMLVIKQLDFSICTKKNKNLRQPNLEVVFLSLRICGDIHPNSENRTFILN